MRYLSAVALLVCTAVLGFAQDERNDIVCNSTPASVVGHEGKVIVQKLVLTGEWGSNEGMVYLSGKDVAESAVLLSHSAIHADSGESADVVPFAVKLARAGAAVVVAQRILIWPPTDRSINRAGAAVICAQRWLVDHVKVAKNGKPETGEGGGIVRYGYA